MQAHDTMHPVLKRSVPYVNVTCTICDRLQFGMLCERACQCREAALAAVMEFLRGEGVAGAGRLLYEVEFLLLGPPKEEGSAAVTKSVAKSFVEDEEQIVSCRAQLLAVVAETILDESMPAAAVPFLIDLFKQSALKLLPANPALKVCMATICTYAWYIRDACHNIV